MTESIHTSEHIVLFGKPVDDLVVPSGKLSTSTTITKGPKQFARIYGFTYDGIYYEIPSPVLFLVESSKEKEASKVDVPGPNPRNKKFFESLKAWTVKQGDETVRLDLEGGKFEDLMGVMGDGADGVSGARVSGARVSGARVSGARVSGARVSGARVSGARISGARDAGD